VANLGREGAFDICFKENEVALSWSMCACRDAGRIRNSPAFDPRDPRFRRTGDDLILRDPGSATSTGCAVLRMGAGRYVSGAAIFRRCGRDKVKVFGRAVSQRPRKLERFTADSLEGIAFSAPAPAELEESKRKLARQRAGRTWRIAAGKMGSWDWDWVNGGLVWDEGNSTYLESIPGPLRDPGNCSKALASSR